MKPSIKSAIALAALTTLSTQAFANIIWNDSNGNWNDSTKWSGGVVPGAEDHAVINDGFLSISGGVVVDSLTIAIGQIQGSGSITTNSLHWTRGNINLGGPNFPVNGVLTVNGHATIGVAGSEVSLAGNWVTNPYTCENCPETTLVLNGNTTLQGKITAGMGKIVNNGYLTLKEGSDSSIDYWYRWWSPLVNNGTIDANAGAGQTARFNNLFDNDGKVFVTSGSFVIYNYSGPLNNNAGSVFHVKSGATADITGNSITGVLNNGGEVSLEQGSTFTASYFVQNSGKTTFDNANLTFTDYDGIKINGGEFVANGNMNAGLTVAGGKVSLGDKPGLLEATWVTLGSASEITLVIAGNERGVTYDAVNGLDWVFAQGGVLNVNFESFEPVLGSKYLLFSGYVVSDENSEYVDGYIFSQLNVSGLDLTKYSYRLDYTGSGITFNVLAVPEPSAYAMLGLGLSLIGFAARRRKIY